MTELFPFGRRSLRHEFQALLSHAKDQTKPPLICASIRDILAPPSRPEKAAKTAAILAEFYDAVLVHSDPEIAPLHLSWPVNPALEAKLWYTGFVAPPPPLPHPNCAGQGEILVSVGGGSVGQPVQQAALAAAKLDPDTVWRILVGGRDAAERINTLQHDAAANVILDPVRPDFRQMLFHAAVSVSLCGYNTALDVLQTGARAVFIPFDDGNEVEQGLRAEALKQLPAIECLRTIDLTPETLLARVNALRAMQGRLPRSTGFDGANQTVHVLQKLTEDR